MSQYLINLQDGRIVDRNPETDKHVNLKPIPDELVGMIMRGEITAKEVTNAISVKMNESGTFNADAYALEKMKLNVRRSNPQEMPVRATLADRSDEEISVDEVVANRAPVDTASKAPRKERVKKAVDVLENAKTEAPKPSLDIFG